MFAKTLLTFTLLALSSVSFAAPARQGNSAAATGSCPAPRTTTVTIIPGATTAPATTTTAAAATTTTSAKATQSAGTGNNNGGSKGNNNNNGAANFGTCSTPEIRFAANIDGQRATRFKAVDTRAYLSSFFYAV